MLARTCLHGDKDDCQRPVQELFPPDSYNWPTVPPPLPKSGLCFFTTVLSLFSKGHCSTLHIYYGSVYTNKQGKSFSYSYYSSSSSYYSSVKIFPATSQSSSSQATEPIVKCHTILEMGSHDLSQHADLGPHFGRGFKQKNF